MTTGPTSRRLPEFTQHSRQPSQELDVCLIRNDPVRWRLKICGCRAIYQVRPGALLIDAIPT